MATAHLVKVVHSILKVLIRRQLLVRNRNYLEKNRSIGKGAKTGFLDFDYTPEDGVLFYKILFWPHFLKAFFSSKGQTQDGLVRPIDCEDIIDNNEALRLNSKFTDHLFQSKLTFSGLISEFSGNLRIENRRHKGLNDM